MGRRLNRPLVAKYDATDHGFSLVEILLAATIFGMTVTAVVGAIVYGNAASAGGGYRNQAVMLADEGVQAARNIRDAAYSNLTDGTYGVTLSGGVMNLTGTSDTTGIFTRQVAVASNGTKRKTITATVTWSDIGGSHSYATSTQLANWRATTKSWTAASQYGLLDLNGANDGTRVETSGKYAYIIRNNTTANFAIVDISTPTAPTLVSTLNLTGTPADLKVSGNYVYVASSNTAGELQIINVTTPASPTLAATYDATGTVAGKSVFVSGGYAFLGRAANGGTAEFVAVNVSTPTSPTLAGTYGNNVTMNDMVVNNGYAYVGTSAGTVLVIKVSTPTNLSLASTYTPSGTGAVSAVSLWQSTVLIGRTSTFSTTSINATTGALTAVGNVASSGTGTINHIDEDQNSAFAFIGTTATAAEFQVVNISTLTAPTIAKVVDGTGTASTVYGVAYNATYDVVVGASAYDNGEVLVYGKN